MFQRRLVLFGGEKIWSSANWTNSDDRVRGGISQSFMECATFESSARFYGNLDISILGGAGFASQRTTGEERSWDLSGYDGIELVVTKADRKRYTFIVKDELLPKNPDNGREQSTISYERDFTIPGETEELSTRSVLFIPWRSFHATYRGRRKKDSPALDTSRVKRFSMMMRSFFGEQEGSFSLSIESISAVTEPPASENFQIPLDSEKGYGISIAAHSASYYAGQDINHQWIVFKRKPAVFGAVIVCLILLYVIRL
ncbi:CIA30-domain-containing protein [Patellaria atrata CBS 101060]|uniref:CIA30-domain-containing protein n=1 Tax=Patellaria atrata CBS 101060 TaxID=1346257 RepID=A0A9P4VSJ8_9PEZI|nr:CIA30-domain-containing protein [Patellaria atrata CBS 101060]